MRGVRCNRFWWNEGKISWNEVCLAPDRFQAAMAPHLNHWTAEGSKYILKIMFVAFKAVYSMAGECFVAHRPFMAYHP